MLPYGNPHVFRGAVYVEPTFFDNHVQHYSPGVPSPAMQPLPSRCLFVGISLFFPGPASWLTLFYNVVWQIQCHWLGWMGPL